MFGDKAPKITAYFKHLVRLLRYVKKYIKLEYYDNVFLWSLSHTLALCSGVRQGLITFSMFSTLLLKRSRSLAICSQQEPSRASLLAKLQATRWCTVTSSLKHTWNKTKDKSMLTFFFFFLSMLTLSLVSHTAWVTCHMTSWLTGTGLTTSCRQLLSWKRDDLVFSAFL